MSANAKYQAAPQRDSFEGPNYTQAPPSYQAEASRDPVLGQPRGEDDNVPDDFKVSCTFQASEPTQHADGLQFGGSVAEATLPIRMQFVRKVYSILSVTHTPGSSGSQS